MLHRKKLASLVVWTASALIVAAMSAPTQADMIVHTTPAGATISGQTISATVTFTTSADRITVVLENLQADPVSVAQNISSLLFAVGGGQDSGTLTTSSAVPRWVAKDDTYTDGAAASTGWQLRTTDGRLELYVLGVPNVGPACTVLGPPSGCDLYASANGSIAGNGPHNPFLAEVAEFEIEVPGVTEATTITDVTFGFNTAPGDTVDAPEPAALALLILGGAAALMRRRRRQA